MNNESKVENNRNGKPKGLPKSGGRKIGTPNKKSIWLREELQNAGLNWAEEFKKSLNDSDLKRAEILIGLLPYLNPKIKERDSSIPEEEAESPSENSILNIIK